MTLRFVEQQSKERDAAVARKAAKKKKKLDKVRDAYNKTQTDGHRLAPDLKTLVGFVKPEVDENGAKIDHYKMRKPELLAAWIEYKDRFETVLETYTDIPLEEWLAIEAEEEEDDSDDDSEDETDEEDDLTDSEEEDSGDEQI